MKKLTENQQIILNEEMNRAMMLKKAKKSLNEAQYRHFITELAILEEKADRNQISRIELYEGIFKNLYNAALNVTQGLSNKAANYAQKNETSEQIRQRLKAVLEDAATKELFNTLEGYKEKSADELKNDPKYQGLRSQADSTVRETQRLFNLLGRLDPLLKMRDETEEIARAAATLGMEPKELLQMYNNGSAAASKEKADSRRGMDAETTAYVRNRTLYAPDGKPGKDGKDGKDGDDGDDGGEEGGDDTPEAAPEAAPEAEGAKVVTVRSVQRPIINLVQRVSAAQGVDLSVKQAQEIATTITKNLVNQMRANGVEFKGVSKDLKESNRNWDPVRTKNLFLEHLGYIISEERLAAKYGMKKEKFSPKEIGLDRRYKFGAVEPRDYIKTFKAVVQRFKEMGYKEKKTHYELKATDNPDNFVDYYDMYLDLKDLKKFNRGTKRVANGDEVEAINDAVGMIDSMIKKFELHGDFRDPGTGREMRKKFIKMKKEMKGMGKEKDKVDTKDMSMASAEKGKINISQTVAKAIQAGGLDQDVAKKITPILKDKIVKIINKHMGDDVRYLEEKVNRYVKSVIKEIKQ